MSAADRKGCPSCKYLSQYGFAYGEPRVCASAFYPAFYRNRIRYETPVYKAMKRLWSIWAEGSFAVLKREHSMSRAKMRGCERIREHCLFSALALNLKRMVKAIGKLNALASMAVDFSLLQAFFSFWQNITIARSVLFPHSYFVNTSFLLHSQVTMNDPDCFLLHLIVYRSPDTGTDTR